MYFPPGLEAARGNHDALGWARIAAAHACAKKVESIDTSMAMDNSLPPDSPPSNLLLMLIIQGFLSTETLSRCSRLRILASHQVRCAIDEADRSGRLTLRKRLHVIETLLKKSKVSALCDSRRQTNKFDSNELAQTLPDISDILTTEFDSWMQKASYQDFRSTVRLLTQFQQEQTWRREQQIPPNYAKGSYVPAAYEHDIPRYRAIRSMLSSLKLNSIPLTNIHNIAIASRFDS